jgi:hypothetical protein
MVVIDKTQSLQSVIDGIPDVIGGFLGNSLTEVGVPVGGETSQGAGTNHHRRRQDKETALPLAKHSINALTEHPGHSQAKGSGGYQADKSQYQ